MIKLKKSLSSTKSKINLTTVLTAAEVLLEELVEAVPELGIHHSEAPPEDSGRGGSSLTVMKSQKTSRGAGISRPPRRSSR